MLPKRCELADLLVRYPLYHLWDLLGLSLEPAVRSAGLNPAQWGVLRDLHRAERQGLPGLRLTDLSRRLLTRLPSLSGVVDRLERAGVVVRDNSPFDMRAKQVALTAKGREVVERILVAHGRQIDTVLGVLAPTEQGELHRLLSRLEQHLEGVAAEAATTDVD